MSKEQVSEPEILWPEHGLVKVDPSVDFVYVMRQDADFTMTPFAERLASEHELPASNIHQILLAEYDEFLGRLYQALASAFSGRGRFQLHLYDAKQLDQQVRAKASGAPIVSLDPLMSEGAHVLGVSRGYYLSGKVDFGQVPRPGAAPLSDQAQTISRVLDTHAIVAEDDIFSGGSVIASIGALALHGVRIGKLVPGIQVGAPDALLSMGIVVDPVVTYETTDGADIFSKVDLGDPRDYLLGACGLVVQLPNGNLGRAPYILPFVSPAARAGIPKELEREFSVQVLQASLAFYQNVEAALGKRLLLEHTHPDFAAFMCHTFAIDGKTPIAHVIRWSMDNLETIWSQIEAQGAAQYTANQVGDQQ